VHIRNNSAQAKLSIDAPANQTKGIFLADDGTNAWRIEKPAGSNDLVIGDGNLMNSIRLRKSNPGASARFTIGAEDVAINGGFNNIKMTCDGTGIFKELGVLPGANWADYVFEKDYPLMALDSLENFIAIHKHLPEVPTAQEVENNGIRLAEMNALLLKKIEELTLHIINLNKEVAHIRAKK
jgi:hypothetical protein